MNTLDASTPDLPSPVQLLDNLTISKPGKRPQLTNDQKEKFSEVISNILNVEKQVVDIRTLSDEKQTARSISESRGAIKNESIPVLERIFVMRCTGEHSTLDKISKYMDRNVSRAAGIALQIGKKNSVWEVLKVYYIEEKRESAEKLANYFELDASLVHQVVATNEGGLHPAGTMASKKMGDIFVNKNLSEQIKTELQRKKCVILQGPPGTGKTTLAQQIGREFVGIDGEVSSIQFHAGYSYDDFVMGWRPSDDKFELIEGHFLDFCDQAASNLDKRYLMIIDEINRGNVSAIFGECFSLIESTKRGPTHAIGLMYKEPGVTTEDFYIPENIFLIGTMNTADRSLAIVDYALRRRFSFINLLPAFNDSEFLKFLESRGLPHKFVEELSKKMNQLNDTIKEDTRSLGPGFEVGHSYFCSDTPEKSAEEWFNMIIEHEIAPLLSEYWYDDPEKAASIVSELKIESNPASTENLASEQSDSP